VCSGPLRWLLLIRIVLLTKRHLGRFLINEE